MDIMAEICGLGVIVYRKTDKVFSLYTPDVPGYYKYYELALLQVNR